MQVIEANESTEENVAGPVQAVIVNDEESIEVESKMIQLSFFG